MFSDMGQRKGELSRRMIDRDWPYQVAIPAELCRGGGYVTTHYFCAELSLCPRQWSFRRNDRDYIVFCFADAAHAEQFRARFGGEAITPTGRSSKGR